MYFKRYHVHYVVWFMFVVIGNSVSDNVVYRCINRETDPPHDKSKYHPEITRISQCHKQRPLLNLQVVDNFPVHQQSNHNIHHG